MSQELKRAAAERAVEDVQRGMVVGLGTGSTATLMIQALGARVRAGLRIVGIPTSEATARQASAEGIALTTFSGLSLSGLKPIDLTIDGADEVHPPTLNLIKGLGGALLREKIVASASQQLIIIVDESKIVDRLGAAVAVPVEVVPFGWEMAVRRLRELGAQPTLRRDTSPGGKVFITDAGHYIVDCRFASIADPESLADQLDRITGVAEHGLFLGFTSRVYVGTGAGVRMLDPPR